MNIKINQKKFRNNINFFLSFDFVLWTILFLTLIISYINILNQNINLWLSVIAYIATVPVIISAVKSIKNKKINIDLLASVALFISIIMKQWNSVIFINLMITSARIFSNYTKNKSKAALDSLIKLRPQKAKIIKENKIVEIAIEKIKIGDLVLVELGEQIPVDGEIINGEAEIDQSSLTGESIPVYRKKGDNVLSSTIVKSGNITVLATQIGKETTFEKFIKLVEESQSKKADIVFIGEKFTTWYIVIIIFLSFIIYLYSKNINLILSILLVSCADDIAIAIPLAFTTSLGHAAKHGVIIKGGNYIELLSKSKIVLIDKTGTLTKGKIKVENIIFFNNKFKEDVLNLVFSISSMSSHPIAKAIIEYSKKEGANFKKIDKFKEIPGKGMMAFINNQEIIIGKQIFLENFGIKIDKFNLEEINNYEKNGFSVVLIGINKKLIGFIIFIDEIRPEAELMIKLLNKEGIEKIIMLTGDNEKVANKIAQSIGIKEFYANLLPEDKLNYIKKYISNKYTTIMIGDGVNDAAALALADVGIAMGTIGSDVAIQSADIALMHDNLKQVPEIIKLGKSTMKIIKQDFWIWGIVNMIGLIFVFSGIFNPELSAAYNFITDFLPLINSLRLFK